MPRLRTSDDSHGIAALLTSWQSLAFGFNNTGFTFYTGTNDAQPVYALKEILPFFRAHDLMYEQKLDGFLGLDVGTIPVWMSLLAGRLFFLQGTRVLTGFEAGTEPGRVIAMCTGGNRTDSPLMIRRFDSWGNGVDRALTADSRNAAMIGRMCSKAVDDLEYRQALAAMLSLLRFSIGTDPAGWQQVNATFGVRERKRKA